MKTKEDLFEYLNALGIEAITYDYDSEKGCESIPGCDCKNLFLKNKKGKFWLVVAKFETKINLKQLAKQLSVGSLRFAGQDDFWKIIS